MSAFTTEPSRQWRPSGSCALFVCDIASFGAEARTDHIQAHVRASLYEQLRRSFDEAGVPFDSCYREDRGDGVMVAVPPEAGTALLVSSVADRLRAELRRHNDVSSEAAQIRLRVAVHIGEAHSDGNGLVGTSVNHAFRILDAAEFKAALRSTSAHLALIVSQRVYDDIVRHGRDLIDPADYRQVEIQVKETAAIAWIRVPGMRVPDTTQGRDIATRQETPQRTRAVDGRTAPNQILFELVDRLLEIPMITTAGGREQVVSALSPEIAGVIPRHAEARHDTYAIIRTCLDYPQGLQELLDDIRGFAGDSLPVRRLEQTIARLLLQS
jgi:hypothetical protein